MKKIFLGIFVIIVSAIIWVIFDANNGNNNLFIEIIQQVRYGDKIGHFFIFGVLALLLNIILDFRKVYFIFLGSGIIFIGVLAEEISQNFLENRTFDFGDLFSDFLGIFFLTFLFLKIKK